MLTSQVFVEGFGVGAYTRLDARAYQGLVDTIKQSRLPYVLPRYQYSFFGQPDAWGGRFTLDTQNFNVFPRTGHHHAARCGLAGLASGRSGAPSGRCTTCSCAPTRPATSRTT